MKTDYTRKEEPSAQLAAILEKTGLADLEWERSITGFTNEVWLTDDYVLKVYHSISSRRDMEKAFYSLAPISGMPQVLAAGDDYLLMRRIRGKSFFSYWPDWSPAERKERFLAACSLAARIMEIPAEDLPHRNEENWQDRILTRIRESAMKLSAGKFVTDGDLPGRCIRAAEKNGYCLQTGNDRCWIHPDFHFDNLLFDTDTCQPVLIDYEDLCFAPCDYFLDTPLRMIRYPWLYANEIDDPRQRKEDYTGLMTWLQQALPRCFGHPQWEKRTALYALAYDLRHLSMSPDNQDLVFRVEQDLMRLEE